MGGHGLYSTVGDYLNFETTAYRHAQLASPVQVG